MSTITPTPAETFTYEGAPGGHDTITIRTQAGPHGITMEIVGLFGTTLFSNPTGHLDVVVSGDDNIVTLESFDTTSPYSMLFDGGDGTGNTLGGRTIATDFTTDGAGNGTIAGAPNTYTNFTSLAGSQRERQAHRPQQRRRGSRRLDA